MVGARFPRALGQRFWRRLGHDGAVTRPPRRRGLGLGGRLDVRRDQAALHKAIADQLVAQAEGAAPQPEPAPRPPELEAASGTAGE